MIPALTTVNGALVPVLIGGWPYLLPTHASAVSFGELLDFIAPEASDQ